MPILGMTDDRVALPRIGVLRKGAEKPNGNRPGADLDYFRFTSEDKAVVDAFRAEFGDSPRDIPVMLPYGSTDENFQSWREAWKAGGLLHRCNGRTCEVHRLASGKYSREPVPCPGGCTPVGRLTVIIPQLQRLAHVLVQTTSIHDIMTLHQNLRAIELMRGDLRGIPFILKRRPRLISTPAGDGNRVRREKWLLSIEADPTWVALQLASMQRAALPVPMPDNRLLTDGETIEVIDALEIGTDDDVAEQQPGGNGQHEATEAEQEMDRVGAEHYTRWQAETRGKMIAAYRRSANLPAAQALTDDDYRAITARIQAMHEAKSPEQQAA